MINSIKLANEKYLNKEYLESYKLYKSAQESYGFVSLDFNIKQCEKKLFHKNYFLFKDLVTENLSKNMLIEKILSVYIGLNRIKIPDNKEINNYDSVWKRMLKNIGSYITIATNNKKIIYTAVFNDDTIEEPEYINKDWDYVCYTNNSDLVSNVFVIKYVDLIFEDHLQNINMLKSLSHIFLAGYDYSLWIDSFVKIRGENIDGIKLKGNFFSMCDGIENDFGILELLRDHSREETERLNNLWWSKLNLPLKKEQSVILNSLLELDSSFTSMGNSPYLNRYFKVIDPIAKKLDTPDISVSLIMLVKDQAQLTKIAIESLFKNTLYSNFELIIVDNNSKDETKLLIEQMKQKYQKITIITNDINKSFSEANNDAVYKAKGQYVCLINNDLEFNDAMWLSFLVKKLSSKNDIAAVGPILIYADYKIQSASISMYFKEKSFVSAKENRFFIKTQSVGGITGACMLVKKDIYKSLGGFDTRYWYGQEDVDFNLKIQKAKYTVVLVSDAEVIHHEMSTREINNTTQENRKKIQEKWKNKIDSDFYKGSYLMLKKANKLFRDGNYSDARDIYLEVYSRLGMSSLQYNIDLCEKNIINKSTSSNNTAAQKSNKKIYKPVKPYTTKHSHIFKQSVESINLSGIRGWIYDLKLNTLNDKVNLIFVIDNNIIEDTYADLDRADIKRVFNIHCISGYNVNIPLEYLDGEKHTLKIIANKDGIHYLIKETSFSEESKWVYKKKKNEKVVLFCTHNLRSQGAQNSLYELALGLRRLYNITPVVYSPELGPLETKYENSGIKVIIDKSFKTQCETIEEWEHEVDLLSLKLQQLQCDIVIANTLRTFYMLHGANRINVPSIFIPRESEPPKTYYDYLPEAIRGEAYKSMKIASQVVFVANATKKPWLHMDNYSSYKVIHNSLNTSLLNQDSIYSKEEIRNTFGIDKNDIVLLSLGTVSSRKGQLDFIKSLPEIFKKSNKSIKAFMVGIDTYKDKKTQEYSKEIYDILDTYAPEIRKNIFLIPETDKLSFTKPYEFYAMADIYVFTSRIESFPRVMLEALYFGLPVVSTPCFGIVEQCIENYNAYYYEEEDIETLTLNTLKLVNDDKQREEFSEASKVLFKQLQTYDQMIQNYYRVIQNIEKGNK